MKRSATILLCFVMTAIAARAQSVHSADRGLFSVTIGAEASIFQPDYIGTTNAQSNGLSIPYGLTGVGVYSDIRVSRWIQLEAEARWSQFNINEVSPNPPINGLDFVPEVGEKTFLVGPRIPILQYKRLTPYGKVLFGVGRTSTNHAIYQTSHNSFNSFAMAYGGGLDYRLTKRINIRIPDIEYQQWNLRINETNLNNTVTAHHFPIHPWGASAGVSYTIF